MTQRTEPPAYGVVIVEDGFLMTATPVHFFDTWAAQLGVDRDWLVTQIQRALLTPITADGDTPFSRATDEAFAVVCRSIKIGAIDPPSRGGTA